MEKKAGILLAALCAAHFASLPAVHAQTAQDQPKLDKVGTSEQPNNAPDDPGTNRVDSDETERESRQNERAKRKAARQNPRSGRANDAEKLEVDFD